MLELLRRDDGCVVVCEPLKRLVDEPPPPLAVVYAGRVDETDEPFGHRAAETVERPAVEPPDERFAFERSLAEREPSGAELEEERLRHTGLSRPCGGDCLQDVVLVTKRLVLHPAARELDDDLWPPGGMDDRQADDLVDRAAAAREEDPGDAVGGRVLSEGLVDGVARATRLAGDGAQRHEEPEPADERPDRTRHAPAQRRRAAPLLQEERERVGRVERQPERGPLARTRPRPVPAHVGQAGTLEVASQATHAARSIPLGVERAAGRERGRGVGERARAGIDEHSQVGLSTGGHEFERLRQLDRARGDARLVRRRHEEPPVDPAQQGVARLLAQRSSSS